MIIGYKQRFPWGDPTNFKEKIITGDLLQKMSPEEREKINTVKPGSVNFLHAPKIHTLRTDPRDRWHRRRNEFQRIHHSYGTRTKNYECFLQNECTGYQDITIFWKSANFEQSFRALHGDPVTTHEVVFGGGDTKYAKLYAKEKTARVRRLLKQGKPRDIGKSLILHGWTLEVYIDSILVSTAMLEDLARNDGFSCLYDFMRWFCGDWSGKIIHWTEYRYTFAEHEYIRAREIKGHGFSPADIQKIVDLKNANP